MEFDTICLDCLHASHYQAVALYHLWRQQFCNVDYGSVRLVVGSSCFEFCCESHRPYCPLLRPLPAKSRSASVLPNICSKWVAVVQAASRGRLDCAGVLTMFHPAQLISEVVSVALHKLMTKVKSNYFIVRPKVDQRTGLLSLPHLGNFRRTAPHLPLPLLRKHSPEGDNRGSTVCTSS